MHICPVHNDLQINDSYTVTSDLYMIIRPGFVTIIFCAGNLHMPF